MAVSWGSFDDHLSVGIDLSVSGTTITAKYYVRTDSGGWNWADDQTLHLTGAQTGSVDYYAGMSGPYESKLVATRTRSGSRGTSYTFGAYVSGAYNGASPSQSRSISVPAAAPDRPSAPNLSNATSDGYRMSYSLPDGNGATVTEGQYQTSRNSGYAHSVRTATTTGSPMTIRDLVASGTRYYARVRFRNSAGWSAWSSSDSIVLDVAKPSAPTSLSVTGSDWGSISYSWSPPSDDGGGSILEYQIQVDNSSGFGSPALDAEQTSRTRTASGLDPDTVYYARVRARTAGGWGPWSSTVSRKTAIGTPSAPRNVALVRASPDALVVGFTPPANLAGSAVTSYQVSASAGSSTITATGSGSPITLAGLDPATSYAITVRAQNGAGWGAITAPTFMATLSSVWGNDSATWAYVPVWHKRAGAWRTVPTWHKAGGTWQKV